MIDRREMMKRAGMAALATGFGSFRALALDAVTLPIDNGERPLVKYPQKRPMIGLTSRPPQLETPFSVFNDGAITPNNAFFVRYHLADVPLNIDPDKFTLEIKGKVDPPNQAVAEGNKEASRGRARRRQSMLGQQPRLFQSTRGRRAIGQRCDG
jgi:DMSO/TMAO reductase YedYZ molybdopterin-dependent catalytic subunit